MTGWLATCWLLLPAMTCDDCKANCISTVSAAVFVVVIASGSNFAVATTLTPSTAEIPVRKWDARVR